MAVDKVLRQARRDLNIGPGGGGKGKKDKKGKGKVRKESRHGVPGEVGPDGKWRPDVPGTEAQFYPGTNQQVGQSKEGHKGSGKTDAETGKGPKTEFDVVGSEEAGQTAEDLIREQWEGLISGKISSFGPERAAALKQELLENARGRERQELEAADIDMIRRGVFNTGMAARAARDIRRGTSRDISKGEREIKLKQIAAEFTDRMAGLQMAQNWLTSKRNYELGKERNEIAREQIRATMALGYAQIAASKQNARIAAGAARAGLGLAREQFEFAKSQAAVQLADSRRVKMAQMADNLG
jgi:hypothetical protein